MTDLKSKNAQIVDQDYQVLKAAFANLVESPLCRNHICGCLEYYYDTCQLGKALLNEAAVNSFADSYVPHLVSESKSQFTLSARELMEIEFTRFFMLQVTFQLLPIMKERFDLWVKRPEQSFFRSRDWHSIRYGQYFNDSVKVPAGEKDVLTKKIEHFIGSLNKAYLSYDNTISSLIKINEGFIGKKAMKYSENLDSVITKDDYFQEACFAIDRSYCMYEPGKSQILTFLEMVISSKFNNLRKKAQTELSNATQKQHLVRDTEFNGSEGDPLNSTQVDVDISSLMKLLSDQDEKVQKVIGLRFGLTGTEESSYEMIAEAIGRSRESVRTKDLPDALETLRNIL